MVSIVSIVSVFRFFRIIFALLTIIFTIIWTKNNHGFNRFASRAAEKRIFTSYPEAKSFLNSSTLWSIIGFLSFLALETRLKL